MISIEAKASESRVSNDKIEYPLGRRPHNCVHPSLDADFLTNLAQQNRMVYIVGINQDR